MDGINGTSYLDGLKIASSPLLRFAPQPAASGIDFGAVLKAVSSVAAGALGLESAGLNSDYRILLQEQLEVQRQMFLMSLYSNLEKSKHETQMAAVRNIRVG